MVKKMINFHKVESAYTVSGNIETYRIVDLHTIENINPNWFKYIVYSIICFYYFIHCLNQIF